MKALVNALCVALIAAIFVAAGVGVAMFFDMVGMAREAAWSYGLVMTGAFAWVGFARLVREWKSRTVQNPTD